MATRNQYFFTYFIYLLKPKALGGREEETRTWTSSGRFSMYRGLESLRVMFVVTLSFNKPEKAPTKHERWELQSVRDSSASPAYTARVER